MTMSISYHPTHRRAARALGGALVAVMLAGMATPATAQTDPANDFVPGYTGPRNGDLDVRSFRATFDGATFRLDATTGARIGTTATGLYVWGFNRGQGTAAFAAIGATDVLFDSVVIINPAGGMVTIVDAITGSRVNLPASAITVSGNSISAVIPASMLTPRGFAQANYLVNLWPRSGVGGNNLISDFAPDNATARLILAFPVPIEASVQTEQVIDDASSRFGRVQNRLAVQRTGEAGGRFGGFLSAGARFGNRGIGDSLAQDTFSRTVEGGLDYAVGSNAVIGAGFAANRSTATLSNRGSLRAKIYSPSIYAGFKLGGLTLDAYGAYSIVRADMTRMMAIGSTVQAATSSPDGHAYTAGGALGFAIRSGGLTVTPLADALFTRVTIDRYAETSTNGFGSTLARRQRESIRLGLGGEVRYGEQQGWGSYSLHLRARAIQELGDQRDLIAFAYTAQPTIAFGLRGPNTGRTYAAVDAGTDLATKGGLRIGFSYAPRIDRDGFVDHAGSLTLGKRF